MLVFFEAIWSILRPFGIFHYHLVNCMVIWYIFPRFGMLLQEKSGNPDSVNAIVNPHGARRFLGGKKHIQISFHSIGRACNGGWFGSRSSRSNPLTTKFFLTAPKFFN
jgi:hypothetical protein